MDCSQFDLKGCLPVRFGYLSFGETPIDPGQLLMVVRHHRNPSWPIPAVQPEAHCILSALPGKVYDLSYLLAESIVDRQSRNAKRTK
jgi:hypothetical protein